MDMWSNARVSRSRGALVPVTSFAAYVAECASPADAPDGCITGMLVDGQTAFFECCCGQTDCRL